MSGKQILSMVLAVVFGIIAVKVIFWLIGVAFSLLGWVLALGVAGVVVYALYRGFNNMLTSGKRLT
jgi:hypothetical protein